MSKKKKIYYMVYSLESGGIERYSINLYKYINKDKYKLDFIAWSEDKEFFDDDFINMGGNKICLKKNTKNLIGLKKKFKIIKNCIKSVFNDDYHIAYFNISQPSSIIKFPLLCKLRGMKIIIHSHNSNAPKRSKFDFFYKFIMNLIVDKYLSCSDKAAEYMFPNSIVEAKKYELINNGIEAENYIFNSSKRELLRTQNNLSNKFVIGHIGRFNIQKNHFFIIDIFYEIVKINSNSILILIGTGELVEEVKKYVESKQLNDKVIFVGTTNEIPNYLQMFDIFLLPSLFEGLPIVGIEAQASGVKSFLSSSITTEVDITGIVDFIPLETNAIEWAQKICKYRNGYDRKNTLEYILHSGYDISATASRVEEIFDEIK